MLISSYQFIKKVNETELRKRGTKDSYVGVPKKTNVDDIFTELNVPYKFKHKSTGKLYDFRLTSGREQRIVGMGSFYKDINPKAGSRICFERRIYPDGTNEYLIDIISNDNSLVLQVSSSHGVRILNGMDNAELKPHNLYKTYFNGEYVPIYLEYSKTIKPRVDSKIEDDYYNLVIDNKIVNSNYLNDAIIEIVFKDGICEILEDISYQKIVIERV
jgi:hypothetical protein